MYVSMRYVLYGDGTGGFVQDILFDMLVVCAAVLRAKDSFQLLTGRARRSDGERDPVTHTRARAHTHRGRKRMRDLLAWRGIGSWAEPHLIRVNIIGFCIHVGLRILKICPNRTLTEF